MVEGVPADELWTLLLQTHQLDLDQGQNPTAGVKGRPAPIYLRGLEIALAIYRVGVSREITLSITSSLWFLYLVLLLKNNKANIRTV